MIEFLSRSLHLYRIPPVASRLASIAGTLGLLGGCGTLGAGTIITARTPVNEAVATTARQQTLMNIVRVYNNESPVILDVVEADEAVAVNGQAMGGAASIGSIVSNTLAGQTGSANATVGAADAVTNRYVPLQGQALISQLSTQITVETLNALYDSDWPIQSLIEFGMVRLTPYLEDFALAEDLLTELDAVRAISLATAKSGFSKKGAEASMIRSTDRTITINTQAPASGGGDTLNVYFKHPASGNNAELEEAQHAWNRLTNLYRGTQPGRKGKEFDPDTKASFIELRNSPITDFDHMTDREFESRYLGPVMRTYTAIGILKYITSQPKVAFLDQDQYRSVRMLKWNSDAYFKRCPDADSYILDPIEHIRDQPDDNHVFGRVVKVNQDVIGRIQRYLDQVVDGLNVDGDDHNRRNCIFSYATSFERDAEGNKIREFSKGLSELRRLIIIVRSRSPIRNAFASWNDGGIFYSIMPDDSISQRNLMLAAQFLTIQATSTPTPSLTTISPNGR